MTAAPTARAALATAAAAMLIMHSVMAAPPPPRPHRPHILLILADDFGWSSLGAHRRSSASSSAAGGAAEPPSAQALAEAVTTPNLDALLEHGIHLEHHIAYKICAPSRASLLSGRLAVHVAPGNTAPSAYNAADPVSGFAGIPTKMTTLGSRLREQSYRTAFYGKWDVGMATPAHTPLGRGFEDSLFFYHHANNYYDCGVELEATGEINVCLNRFTDLSEANATHRGGYTRLAELQATAAATGDDEIAYVENLFRARALRTIDQHDINSPLFLYYAFHLVHTPMQVPFRYLETVDRLVEAAGGAPFDSQNRRLYSAMTLFMDEVIGDLVSAFKAKSMWDNTLFVFLSDNGGPVYLPGAVSNYPLRGGKYSDFDGGVRTVAFLSGGAVPPAKRGSSFGGVISIADWYATILELAGQPDPFDTASAEANVWMAEKDLPLLPAVDSRAQWDAIMTGVNARPDALHLSEQAVLRWPYKLLTGVQPYSSGWTGQLYPNCSTRESVLRGDGPMFVDGKVFGSLTPMGESAEETARRTWAHDCGTKGCLVNIQDDPTEHVDLAIEQAGDPTVVALRTELREKLAELNLRLFTPERGEDSVEACQVALANGGFYGPWTDLNWYSTPPKRGMANHPWHDRLYMAIVRLLSEEKARVQDTSRYLIPKLATTLARKWDTCSPSLETPGIVANGFKVDKVLIPVLLALSFWKHCIGVALGLWFAVWLMRQQRRAHRIGDTPQALENETNE